MELYITSPEKCNRKTTKEEVMFELSLKSVCLVSAGKNFPGR